jgi:hypothetical protein
MSPEPDESSSHPHTVLICDTFNIFPSTLSVVQGAQTVCVQQKTKHLLAFTLTSIYRKYWKRCPPDGKRFSGNVVSFKHKTIMLFNIVSTLSNCRNSVLATKMKIEHVASL